MKVPLAQPVSHAIAMNSNLQCLRSQLLEISDLGTVSDDQDINRIGSFTALLEQARSLGIVLDRVTTLGQFRRAVEHASSSEPQPYVAGSLADQILGNASGIPGEGP